MPEVATPVVAGPRQTRSLTTGRDRRRLLLVIAALAAIGIAAAAGLLVWDNPLPVGSEGFWLIAQRRATQVVVMLVVAICQAIATISFQTVANNRIVTPSIMGFEALYVTVQTASVYFFGLAGLIALQGVTQFALQVAMMVVFAVLLYSWLLSGRYGNLHVMLLVGIIIGGGLGSISTFMRRLLSPSEFDVLAARLFGNVSNADAAYLPLAIPLVIIATAAVWRHARRLNVLALGKDAAINLGLNYRREVMLMLFWISVLIAVSTALVGPMIFFGFLVATLTYQLVNSFDHRLLLPVGALAGFAMLAGSYLVMRHVFYAEGVVSIIIELVGGSVFLIAILRKGTL